MKIPKDYSTFLNWIKQTTEEYWSTPPERGNELHCCPEWLHNAKWIGLKEAEIDAIEKEHQIEFTVEHRAFLRVLHTTNKRKKVKYKDPSDDSKVLTKEEALFYNWKLDLPEIKKRFDWQFDYIWDDILGINKSWLPSWGKKPKSDYEKKVILSNWYKTAPPIIPINHQHYIVSQVSNIQNPVLSMRGFDIIVLGWNMRHYLLNELQEHLNLIEWIFDEDSVYEPWSHEPIEMLNNINKKEYQAANNKDIPIWKEMILYYEIGYLSFGLPYPHR